ncbi:hypothetical protein PG996_008171 [Apiospora saccharicola]|uniref:Uncharacterized protein n=1 Tax=Apiospora saccharicola TaxID=335842 RepID=A0ABR1UX57_9PEZI
MSTPSTGNQAQGPVVVGFANSITETLEGTSWWTNNEGGVATKDTFISGIRLYGDQEGIDYVREGLVITRLASLESNTAETFKSRVDMARATALQRRPVGVIIRHDHPDIEEMGIDMEGEEFAILGQFLITDFWIMWKSNTKYIMVKLENIDRENPSKGNAISVPSQGDCGTCKEALVARYKNLPVVCGYYRCQTASTAPSLNLQHTEGYNEVYLATREDLTRPESSLRLLPDPPQQMSKKDQEKLDVTIRHASPGGQGAGPAHGGQQSPGLGEPCLPRCPVTEKIFSQLTRFLATNYGVDYNAKMRTQTTPFSEAPEIIRELRDDLTSLVADITGEKPEFNEGLAIGNYPDMYQGSLVKYSWMPEYALNNESTDENAQPTHGYDEEYLAARHDMSNVELPSYPLLPAPPGPMAKGGIVRQFNDLGQRPKSDKKIRRVNWEGFTCMDCFRLNQRLYWNRLECRKCGKSFPYGMPKFSFDEPSLPKSHQ